MTLRYRVRTSHINTDWETNRMRSILSRIFGIIGLLLGAPLAHAQQWTEGKHYFEIKPAQRPPDAPAGVVEVTEVFSYACVYCNRAIPMMEKIKKSLPANARLGYLPAVVQLSRVVADVSACLLRRRCPRSHAEDARRGVQRGLDEQGARSRGCGRTGAEIAAADARRRGQGLRQEGRHQARAVPRRQRSRLPSRRTAAAPISS